MYRLVFDFLTATESQHLGNQCCRPPRCILHVFQIAGQFSLFLIHAVIQGKTSVTRNNTQQVVEVVGNAAGQLSQSPHLSGLLKFPLQAFVFDFCVFELGDVLCHPEQVFWFALTIHNRDLLGMKDVFSAISRLDLSMRDVL